MLLELIAETAWHHDGDMDFLKGLVNDLIKKTTTDIIKFHITLDVDEYMHTDHPGYEWAQQRIFSESNWDELFKLVKGNNRKLMLLFNDTKAIDFGMKYQPELMEVHSVCLNDIKLLNHLGKSINNKQKVVLGIGGSTLYEVENAIKLLNTSNITLMHGFQNYPTKYEDINLMKMRKIMGLYPEYQHGYADHTAYNHPDNLLITLMGAATGVKYIEKHVTTQPGEGRTDWQAAISIEQLRELKDELSKLEKINGNGLLGLNKGEQSYSIFGSMKKAAILNKNVKKGEELSLNLIDFKRTGQSTDLSQLEVLNSLGKKIIEDLHKGHCVKKSNIENQ